MTPVYDSHVYDSCGTYSCCFAEFLYEINDHGTSTISICSTGPKAKFEQFEVT